MDKSFSGTIVLTKKKINNKNTASTQAMTSKVCQEVQKVKLNRRKNPYYIPSQFPKLT